MALRTLLQLANDVNARFPLGAQVGRKTSYMDNFLAEGDDDVSALEVKIQLTYLMLKTQ